MTAPVLGYSGNDCQFCLECDASNYATGAVLSVLKEDKWHPVAYHSHSMSPEEQNYPIADKEMLSIIRALKIWRHYLEGTKHEFKVLRFSSSIPIFFSFPTSLTNVCGEFPVSLTSASSS